jgi:hypothetical protein
VAAQIFSSWTAAARLRGARLRLSPSKMVKVAKIANVERLVILAILAFLVREADGA